MVAASREEGVPRTAGVVETAGCRFASELVDCPGDGCASIGTLPDCRFITPRERAALSAERRLAAAVRSFARQQSPDVDSFAPHIRKPTPKPSSAN